MKTLRSLRRLGVLLAASLLVGSLLAGCATTSVGATVPGVAAAPATTPASAVTLASSRVIDVRVPSAALGRNVSVRIVVPGSYYSEPAKTWPVLYLLHGSPGSYLDWTGISDDVVNLSATSGVMVVMPDGGKAGYYSNWKKGAQWETFHLAELPSYLAKNYRANTAEEAIGGFSAGGFGALSYAARHPGRFKAVMALSPVANPLRNPSIVLSDIRQAYSKKVQYNLWGNPKTSARTWKKHDPYYLAKGLANTTVYLYAGTGHDAIEPTLRAQTIRLVKKLKSLGLTKLKITLIARTSTYGTHSGTYWAREFRRAWPTLISALGQ